jgi:hypothetical protein
MDNQTYVTVGNSFRQIGLIFFTIVGIFGNLFVFYILTRPKFLKETIFRYFIASEVVGSLNLVFSWLLILPILLKWDAPVAYCKIAYYLLYSTYSTYPWISVVNSIDRYLSIKYLSKFQFRKETKYQILTLLIVSLVFLFANIPYIIYEEKSTYTLCTIIKNKVAFYIQLSKLISTSIVPSFIMILSMCQSVHHLVVKKRRLYLQKNKISYKRERNFLKSVLTMEIWFIICYSPVSIISFLKISLDLENINLYLWEFLLRVFSILAIIQSSCSFFVLLYCNKQFRKYFYSMITSFRCKIEFH